MIKDPLNRLQTAYDFYNQSFFNGDLPQCEIRFTNIKGLISALNFDRKNTIEDILYEHEILLNPDHLDEDQLLSNIVYLQCKLKEFLNGDRPSYNYSNQKFAQLLESFGLVASDTGKEGGKKLGKNLSFYVQPNGLFSQVTEAFKIKLEKQK